MGYSKPDRGAGKDDEGGILRRREEAAFFRSLSDPNSHTIRNQKAASMILPKTRFGSPPPRTLIREIFMRVFHVLLPLIAAFFAMVSVASADENALVFVGSDLSNGPQSVSVKTDGAYTVKVWASAKVKWTLKADSSKIQLVQDVEDSLAAPGWLNLGTISLKPDDHVSIDVVGASFESASISGDYRKQKQTIKPAPASATVPAVVSLSIDPNYVADLSLIRGQTERVEPTADSRRSKVRTNHEGASFRPPATAKDWESRSKDLKEQLSITLGLVPGFPKTPLNPQFHGKLERDGYTIEKVTIETMPGVLLGGNLYRPSGNCRRVPVILCPHGHWEDGRVNTEVQPRCIQWAKLGCIVFLYDMVGYNDSKAFGHAFLNERLNLNGFSLPTLQTWNSIRALDWLVTLPDVDAGRIGCTGESGGGTQTFLLSALDPRVAVSAPVVMVSERFQGGCVCENVAGLRVGTDNVEIAALAAPRPMMLVGATGDWSSNTTTKIHPAIRGVYDLVGDPSHLEGAIFDFPHNYNETSRNAVYAFMSRWLLNNNDAASTREGTQTLEKPEDLWAFTTDHPAPSFVKTPESVESDLVALRARQMVKLAPGEDATAWDASKSLLSTIHRVRAGISVPASREISARKTGQTSRDGYALTHWVLSQESTGAAVPAIQIDPEKSSGRVAIVFHDRGKAGLFTGSGKPIPMVRALLDRGVGVVGFDPLFVGESFDPVSPSAQRPRTAHFLTYNPALATDRMNDLATVLAWTRGRTDVHEISLVGLGSAGSLTLLARPSLSGIARTFVDLESFDYGDGSKPVPEELKLAGVLQFGGLAASASLASPSPLWIARPGVTFDASWPTKAYTLAGVRESLKIEEASPTAEAVAKWIDIGE